MRFDKPKFKMKATPIRIILSASMKIYMQTPDPYRRKSGNKKIDFLKLYIETIKTKITLGSYQIEQALIYIVGHFDKEDKYII